MMHVSENPPQKSALFASENHINDAMCDVVAGRGVEASVAMLDGFFSFLSFPPPHPPSLHPTCCASL